ncbi:YeaC family protein [Catenovulum maritimum]|uniref:DUF1315 domain-containing protein n=1 Tax=Catenovulum maritimum TaxID=1513271 RepID=A0A0J8GQE8_9ALTE|nr:DUF1315 family protein [Catenovulum maritimum]KMT64967.1 hypothetical protein XM47_11690 [Catenovulum maritimum]
MNFLEMIDSMPESVYLNLKQAVELGKWGNGEVLTEEQKQNAIQAVLAWQAKNNITDEQFTIGADGQLIEKSRQQLKDEFQQGQIVRFKHDDI